MPTLEWKFSVPLWFGHAGSTPLRLEQHLPGDIVRGEAERYIQDRFLEAHGAEVRLFMPELWALRGADDGLCATAGIRLAEHDTLFLEHYLDNPIEQLAAGVAGGEVPRRVIVEVGNLAASNIGSARLCIITVTWLLARRGLEWVVFTGNVGLVNSFNRLGLRPVTLCLADPMRLGEQRHEWGRYYQTRPSVHIGNIRTGFAHLTRLGLFERFGLPPLSQVHSHVA
ncbi:thermostable hemolysin [Pseudomonas sp. LJDD11]|uniref:thermostable hemolysin n=1 Tax=Pseudomonas sp. LJDD11 TaxID=2931984 RepID=UPI00211C01B5|nr:thermostable hemolysin [Pseudomonas sp. LJDD11]MCQ9422559.1 thermostable hemolysin [Pseudomonas sp. LJDD11]